MKSSEYKQKEHKLLVLFFFFLLARRTLKRIEASIEDFWCQCWFIVQTQHIEQLFLPVMWD